ncbi:glyoxylate reductase/hydroxypyruvate reductase-like isoform X2 [Ischnura elegans]|uniref:glyoxylate reductase/hydroxypyruvate reductase-like isoform X2 n=1 Tax=Ischnura elegans TaxID=197161 RepID=UPI001ED86EC9|nr:glyoxylate reductase/hydroxypyruvate reductase-like isoform X2 [Ischnura elegans]
MNVLRKSLFLQFAAPSPIVTASFATAGLRSKFIMSKPKVFVTRPDIPIEAIDLLKERAEVSMWEEAVPVPRSILLEQVNGKDALFCTLTDRIDKELVEAAGPGLRVIGTMSVGYDHVDTSELKKRGIKLGYTPDVLTDSVADLTVGLLLASSRRFFEANQSISRGAWTSWSPMWMCGQGLKDSVVGIVGMGRIGKAVVQRLQPFGVKQFLYFGRSRKADDSEVNAEYVTLDQLLMQSDFVIVTCALTKETNKMFGSEAFKKMKRTAIFVNTSRGDLVDQDALVDALKYKRIAAAGLDVMTPEPLPSNHELLSLNNCAILPHIGSATVRTRTDMALLTAHNILAGLEGNPMPAEVC